MSDHSTEETGNENTELHSVNYEPLPHNTHSFHLEFFDPDPEQAAGSIRSKLKDWEYPGEATFEYLDPPNDLEVKNKPLDAAPHLLGQWTSTAISGNDITSSCLYVIGAVAAEAGMLTPFVLLTVVLLLYCFRSVYTEVGQALPLNGGSYTLLLNVAPKWIASLAACLTILSYVSTAVVSGLSAMTYLDVWEWDHHHIVISTIILLGLFALLNLLGVSESAVVALFIFSFHLITLTILNSFAFYYTCTNSTVFLSNWEHAFDISQPVKAFAFGFSAGLLGVSGFESSANFIEQQKPGVFPKTLRNMWVCVAIINIVTSFLALAVVPIDHLLDSNDTASQNNLLSEMGKIVGGDWLMYLVITDATMVLSGSVLTSYVGVVGLVRRLALDRCLPQILIQKNFRGTNHFIIIGFFLVCTSLLIILRGDSTSMEGVYTMCFLSVMCLYALGNMALKYKRGTMPRQIQANWLTVIVAFLGVLTGLILTVVRDPTELMWTAIYFSVTLLLVGIMFIRVRLIRYSMFAIQVILLQRFPRLYLRFAEPMKEWARKLTKQPYIFFADEDSLALLNKAVLYVKENEQTTVLKIIHVFSDQDNMPSKFVENIKILGQCYPTLKIDFLAVRGKFGPEIVEYISQNLHIPKNLMFISAPGGRFPHNIATLGGVRVITSGKSRRVQL